jgi:hypothetical protein
MAVDFQNLITNAILPKPDINIELGDYPFDFENKNFYKFKNIIESDIGYPLINLDFLKMRNKDGLPVFAIFSLYKKTCYMSLKLEYSRDSWNSVVTLDSNFTGRLLRSKFKDIYYKLADLCMLHSVNFKHSTSRIELKIESEFTGLVPEHVRKKIREKNNCKFEQIVIIAEADNWTLDEKIEYMPNPDPLVVGVRGDLAYLIEKFDVTRIEEYVSKEFLE